MPGAPSPMTPPLKCADGELLCRESQRDDGWNWHTFIHLISMALGSGSVADASDTAQREGALCMQMRCLDAAWTTTHVCLSDWGLSAPSPFFPVSNH